MVMAWGEEGGTNCENSTDIYALPYAKQTARTEPRNRKGSSLVLGDTSGGVNTRGLGCGGGVGGRLMREGTSVYLRLIHVVAWQKPAQRCEAVILQLKINLKKQIFIEGLLQDEHCSNYWGCTVVEKKDKSVPFWNSHGSGDSG